MISTKTWRRVAPLAQSSPARESARAREGESWELGPRERERRDGVTREVGNGGRTVGGGLNANELTRGCCCLLTSAFKVEKGYCRPWQA